MFAALILVISMAALAQFGVFYLRAALVTTAAEPLSDEMSAAAGVVANSLTGNDFEKVSALHNICPALSEVHNELWSVRVYFRAIQLLNSLSATLFPAAAAWSTQELATCTRYVAVVMDQRLKHNQSCLAEIRSY